jgi:glycosyl transferase family 1
LAARLSGVPTKVRFSSAARYVFVSATTRDRALACGLSGADWGIAHSGIVETYLDRAPERAWEGRLLYVGRIDRRKGIDTVVRALPRLPVETILHIAGDGARREVQWIEDEAEKHGVSDRVRFLGGQSPENVGDLYARADAVIFPVTWEEPWGLVPLEAMARGRPVVATGRGGSGEYLRDGQNCLLFRAGDERALAAAIVRLSSDARLRASLRAGGLETAPLHTETIFNAAVQRELEATRQGSVKQLRTPSRPQPPTISVVMTANGDLRNIPPLVDSLKAQEGPFELIIALEPNADRDVVAGVIDSAALEATTRMVVASRDGRAAAANAGWHESKSSTVLFLVGGVIAQPGLVARHLEAHSSPHGRPFAVLGAVKWGTAETSFMRYAGSEFGLTSPKRPDGDPSYAEFSWANASIEKMVIERLGGFSEQELPGPLADVEFAYRAALDGVRLVRDPRARVSRPGGLSVSECQRRMPALADAASALTSLHPTLLYPLPRLISDAAADTPYRGRVGRALNRWVSPQVPLLGPRVWDNAAAYYRQQLAPAFLETSTERGNE